MSVLQSTDEDSPIANVSRRRSPLKFFLLVFLLSVPFWLIGALTGVMLSADLPVSSLMIVCPVTAAAILIFREDGLAGLTVLLKRSFDFERNRAKAWFIPVVLLAPGIYALMYGAMRVMGLPLPTVQFPMLAGLSWFLAVFIGGLAEELGWSGYAIDPMQARWTALEASLLLGLVGVAWHCVPLLQAHRPPAWIAWWSLQAMAMRVLTVWIYNNTRKSVFAAALFHATANVNIGPFLNFGVGGFPYDALRIWSMLLAVAAVIVTVVWGPRTLARYRNT
jgi:uncharacterized protein